MKNFCNILLSLIISLFGFAPVALYENVQDYVANDVQAVTESKTNDVVAEQHNDSSTYDLKCLVFDDESYCKATLFGEVSSGQTIKFAVWSDLNGQDDLHWYDAAYGDNSYFYDIPIINHRSYGDYNVHAYLIQNSSTQKFLKSAKFQIKKPSIGNLDIDSSKLSYEKFEAVCSDLNSASGIKEIKLAVWSDRNGQDDLRWYSFVYETPITSITKNFTIDINNHFRDLGMYNVHLYVTTVNGINCFIKAVNKKVMFSFNSLSVNLSSDQSEATISLSGSSISNNYSIYFPLWTAARQQTDIKWIRATKQNDSFTTTIHISDYAVSGLYYVHSYIQDETTSSQYFVNSSSFNIDFAKVDSIVPGIVDVSTGKFSITTNIINCPSGISDGNVTACVWSEIYGQDDLCYYTCNVQKISTNIFKAFCDVPLSDHQNILGNYFIHIYIRTNNNIYGFGGAINANIDIEKGVLSSSVSSNEKYINVTLNNTGVTKDAEVKIAVWSDDLGQDDLRWYTMDPNGTGAFKFDVPISEHKSFGKYNIHCYYKVGDTAQKFLGSTTCSYSTKASAKVTAPQSDIDGHNGTFKVLISDVNIPAGIDTMLLPTWGNDVSSANAIWYDEPTKIDDQTYEYIINVNMHRLYFGKYTSHLYIDMGNGIRKFFGSVEITITATEYIGVGYLGNSVFRAVSYGFNSYDISSSKFPTWSIDKESETESQDDLIWYVGTKIDAHNCYCDFNINAHRPEGKHRCDFYIYFGDGNSKCLGKVYFWVTEDQFGPDVHLLHGIRNGIDVSEHQHWINWPAVANSWGAGFAMLRIGFGWANANGRADDYWENNYANARAAGFPVGGYWYSYARNTSEAAQEAYTCLSCLNGRYMDLPIAYDLEQYPGIDYNTNTAMINTFCSIIAAAGYKPMVYASESWFNGKFNVWGLNDNISYWVAQWTTAPIIPRSNMMRIWQTGSKGYISGVSGFVDTDYIYY